MPNPAAPMQAAPAAAPMPTSPVAPQAAAAATNPAAVARATMQPGQGATPGAFGQSVAAAAQARNDARRAGAEAAQPALAPTDVRGFAPQGDGAPAIGPGYLRAAQQRAQAAAPLPEQPAPALAAAGLPEYAQAWNQF